MTRRTIALTLVLAVAATLALEATKIKVQKDPKFDLSVLKTWNWNPRSPGDVKVWLNADSKSEPAKREYEPTLMQAVEEQMTARGYGRAIGPPDFTVTYRVLVAMGDTSQYAGQFLPTNATWGLPMFAPATTSLSVYPQGTLVIDAENPEKEIIVWRGMAEAKLEYETSVEKRKEKLKVIIKDLIAKFPKKKKT